MKIDFLGEVKLALEKCYPLGRVAQENHIVHLCRSIAQRVQDQVRAQFIETDEDKKVPRLYADKEKP